jgi:hypothetical protein
MWMFKYGLEGDCVRRVRTERILFNHKLPGVFWSVQEQFRILCGTFRIIFSDISAYIPVRCLPKHWYPVFTHTYACTYRGEWRTQNHPENGNIPSILKHFLLRKLFKYYNVSRWLGAPPTKKGTASNLHWEFKVTRSFKIHLSWMFSSTMANCEYV